MNQQTAQSIKDALALTNFEIPVVGFTINLFLAGLLSYLLGLIYVRYGFTLSNRKSFGRNFVIISMTTMVIITIVKSSLALSLGLVGALSIVRFRSAIKEPEELGYLFLSIAIGLGLGANQVLITVVGFILIVCVIVVRHFFSKNVRKESNMFFTVTSPEPEKIDINKIISILESGSLALDLKRLDITNEVMEASFLVEFESIEQLSSLTEKIKQYNSKIAVSYLDNQGLF